MARRHAAGAGTSATAAGGGRSSEQVEARAEQVGPRAELVGGNGGVAAHKLGECNSSLARSCDNTRSKCTKPQLARVRRALGMPDLRVP